MEELIKWFETENYEKGIGLLLLHGSNKAMVQQLSRKKKPDKLRYELKKILTSKGINLKKAHAPINVKPVKQKPVIKKKVSVALDSERVNFEDLPEELKPVYKETVNAHRLQRGVHEHLKLLVNASDEDRRPLMDKLFELDERLRHGWAIIDEYYKNGTLPKKTIYAPVVIDHKRINANRKYISINKKELDGPNMAKWLPKIQQRVDELISAGEQFDEKNMNELRQKGIKFNE